MKLLIIDGNAIAHRAYHAIPELTNIHGEHTNAIYGFTSMLINLTNSLKPSHLIVTFDEKEVTFRKTKYANYQAKRPVMDPWLSSQLTKIREWLTTAGVAIYSKSGYEADDVMGTIVNKIGNWKLEIGNYEVVIVTGDRDIFQLITDKIKVYVPVKGLREGKLYGEAEVLSEFDFVPKRMIDYKALVGDSSDNYPGVTGIGPKTARDLIVKYGGIEEIYANLDKLERRVRDKLAKGTEDAIFFKNLATIIKDVPIDFDLDKCRVWNLHAEASVGYLASLGFKTILSRLPKPESQGRLF